VADERLPLQREHGPSHGKRYPELGVGVCLHLQCHLGGDPGGDFGSLMRFLRPQYGAAVLAFLCQHHHLFGFGTLAFPPWLGAAARFGVGFGEAVAFAGATVGAATSNAMAASIACKGSSSTNYEFLGGGSVSGYCAIGG
jgi:hypothetical protein